MQVADRSAGAGPSSSVLPDELPPDEASDEFDTETPAGQSSQVTGHSARACHTVQYSAINAQLATPPSVAADTSTAAESAHTLPNVADEHE
jgi:hypothetical protein